MVQAHEPFVRYPYCTGTWLFHHSHVSREARVTMKGLRGHLHVRVRFDADGVGTY